MTRASVILVTAFMAIGFITAGGLAQQQSQHQQHHQQAQQKTGPQSSPDGMIAKCQTMMEDMKTMHTRMREMDAALSETIQQMNKATGTEKVEAMGATINLMADQRRKMHEMHGTMQAKMMQHMAQHLAQEDGGKSMMNCPTMRMQKSGEGSSKKKGSGSK